jgi:hypothetical protein
VVSEVEKNHISILYAFKPIHHNAIYYANKLTLTWQFTALHLCFEGVTMYSSFESHPNNGNTHTHTYTHQMCFLLFLFKMRHFWSNVVSLFSVKNQLHFKNRTEPTETALFWIPENTVSSCQLILCQLSRLGPHT